MSWSGQRLFSERDVKSCTGGAVSLRTQLADFPAVSGLARQHGGGGRWCGAGALKLAAARVIALSTNVDPRTR
jgi:hypothetical protein